MVLLQLYDLNVRALTVIVAQKYPSRQGLLSVKLFWYSAEARSLLPKGHARPVRKRGPLHTDGIELRPIMYFLYDYCKCTVPANRAKLGLTTRPAEGRVLVTGCHARQGPPSGPKAHAEY